MNNDIYLNALNLNSVGIVTEINCNKQSKRRFLDLGIMRGTLIKPLFRAPFSDPTAYEINNTVVAIRDEDASFIKITPIN